MKARIRTAIFAASLGFAFPVFAAIQLGDRLELFVDDFLIEQLADVSLKLHTPTLAGIALRFDRPWEGPFCGYVTVLKDGNLFRMYYRGLPKSGRDGSIDEVTCYAESTDGLTWTKPSLQLFEVQGTRENNVVLAGQPPFSHNFAPFLDDRPGVAAEERYKALAGTSETGLFGFVSADGLHWRKLRDTPLLTQGAFDSQNVAFWSESEACYAVYLRTWSGGGFSGFRTVSRATSPDFLQWTAPAEMSFGNTPREHLYTSQTHPYFRAPHLYVAVPMRFLPGRKVLTDEQARSLGVEPGYSSDCAEAVFMTSRGGTQYTRTFMEGFIRPGLDVGNWASRAGLTALGIVPTGPTEMSLYKQAHYAQPTCHLLRYSLRTDGFVSVNAPFRGGEFVTRPLTFNGQALVLNFSTGAAGSVRVEIQDVDGKPLPGYAVADADELIGDEIERVVSWKSGSDVSRLIGRPVKLQFAMKDADVYSLRFLVARKHAGTTPPGKDLTSIQPPAPLVISRGEVAGTYQAFPDICRLKNGELFCVFYAGYGHVSLPREGFRKGGRVCCVSSSDEGKTWTPPRILFDGPLDDRDPHIAQMADGTVVCSFFTYRPQPDGKVRCDTSLVTSRDGGQTWDVEARVVAPEWPSSAPVRELADGTRILGVYHEEGSTAYGGAIRSTDGGKTWCQPIPIGQGSGVRLDAETDFVCLKEGTLYAALRGDRVNMHFATSRDRGLTWSTVKDIGFPGHCPHFTRLSTGEILLTHRLPNTALHVSRDEGQSWQGPYVIDQTPGAYPSTVELKDGTVLVVYYEEGTGSGIRARRFKLSAQDITFLQLGRGQ